MIKYSKKMMTNFVHITALYNQDKRSGKGLGSCFKPADFIWYRIGFLRDMTKIQREHKNKLFGAKPGLRPSYQRNANIASND